MGSPSILDDLDAYEAPDSGPVVVEANAGAIRTPKGTHWAAVGEPRAGHTDAGGAARWWVPFLMPGTVRG
jgi:hypothetical protein